MGWIGFQIGVVIADNELIAMSNFAYAVKTPYTCMRQGQATEPMPPWSVVDALAK